MGLVHDVMCTYCYCLCYTMNKITDAGTPYQVKIIGINEFHTTEESIVSPIFFTSEKSKIEIIRIIHVYVYFSMCVKTYVFYLPLQYIAVPSVPPFGITQTLLSGNNSSMLKWLQPTLSEARGFIVGYSLTYACTINRNSTKVKLYETTQSYFYLQNEDNSTVTCSISVCVRTIAGVTGNSVPPNFRSGGPTSLGNSVPPPDRNPWMHKIN